MKIYLAARFNRKDEVTHIGTQLSQAGHEVNLDWTTDTPLTRPYDSQKDEAAKRATRDLEAVKSSDIFILLTEAAGENKGMYVELGAAIASFLEHGKPKIYVVGDYISHGVFFFHPAVIRRPTIDAVINEL